MSKLLWLLGAGAGAMALAALGGKDDEKAADDPGGTRGDLPTVEPDPSTTGGTASPPASGGKPSPGSTVDPVVDPWIPMPYDSYEHGPYTIDLTGLATGIRWRVWATSAAPKTEAAKDTVAVGAGVEKTDEEARTAATAYATALGEPPVHPYPLPPKPTPDASGGPDGGAAPQPPARPSMLATHPGTLAMSGEIVQRHGLNVSHDCTRISVDSVVSWIAWAEPYVRAHVVATPRAKLVLGLLEASFPGCSWDLAQVRVEGGRPLLETLAGVEAKYFAKARAGLPWPEGADDEPLPLERAVAELVGVAAPAVAAPEFAYLGHHVEVDPTAAGWVWKAWRRGKHAGLPDLRGGPHGTTASALSQAKTMIVDSIA